MPEEIKAPPVEATPPPAAPAAPVAEAPPPSKVVERLSKLGFENVTEEDALERLASAYEQQREQFSRQIQDIRNELLTNAPVAPEPVENTAPDNWWNPPQADLTVASRYRNSDGSWKPETPIEVRTQVERLEQYRDNFARTLVADPEKALEPLLEKKFNKFFEQKFGQLTAQQQYEREVAANPWLWQKDPHTGQPTNRLSPEGERFNELMIEVERDIPDKAKAFRWAMKLREAEKAASAATRLSPEQAAEANNEKKAGLIGRAAPAVNRAGSQPAPGKETVRNRNLTFGQKVVQTMQAGA
jgi:hypothetical protein